MKLKNLCEINMGQSPESEYYNDRREGLPFFQGNADFGKLYPSARIWCSEPKKIAQVGDILMSVRAPIGAMNIANVVCCIGRGLASIKVRDTAFLKYIWYALKSKVEELQSKGTGSTFKAINKAVLEELEISVPSIGEQQRIADELDKVSGLIEKRQQQLDKLDLLIKSRFVEMFGDPINENINSNKIKLGEVAILKAGKNVTSANIHNKNEQYPYPCYGGNGIRGYVSNYSHDGCFCLIGRQGALCGNVQLAEGKFYPTEHAVVVKIKKAVNVKWLYYILTYLNLNRFQTGAAQPGLNIEILNSVEIPFPPIDLQNQFADFVDKVEQSKIKIKNSMDKLITLKKALMQKYFG